MVHLDHPEPSKKIRSVHLNKKKKDKSNFSNSASLQQTWTVSWSTNPTVKREATPDVVAICEDEASWLWWNISPVLTSWLKVVTQGSWKERICILYMIRPRYDYLSMLNAYHNLGSLTLLVVQSGFRELDSCNLCEGNLRECLRLNLYPHEGILR